METPTAENGNPNSKWKPNVGENGTSTLSQWKPKFQNGNPKVDNGCTTRPWGDGGGGGVGITGALTP